MVGVEVGLECGLGLDGIGYRLGQGRVRGIESIALLLVHAKGGRR